MINKQFLGGKNKNKCRLNALFILFGEDMKTAEYRKRDRLVVVHCSIYHKTVTRPSLSIPRLMHSVCRRFA
jgi:hypothetical protein